MGKHGEASMQLKQPFSGIRTSDRRKTMEQKLFFLTLELYYRDSSSAHELINTEDFFGMQLIPKRTLSMIGSTFISD